MGSKAEVKVIVSSRSREQIDQSRIAKRHSSLGYVSSFLKSSNTTRKAEDKSSRSNYAKV